MTPLRQRMLETMTLKGFAATTQKSYLEQVTRLAQFYHRSPDKISFDELKRYLLYCHQQRHWSHSSCRQLIHAIKFFYLQVLKRPFPKEALPFPKREQKIPELLSRQEVRRILSSAHNLKFITALTVIYGAGLRVSECARLRVSDLDGERNVLRIENSKGRKDRYVDFTDGLKRCLRVYWEEYHPTQTVFYTKQRSQPQAVSGLQHAYTRAKLKAGVRKHGGIHALRHAYATHQLEDGMPLTRLQQQLGHAHIGTTLRYTRWLSGIETKPGTYDLLVGLTDGA